MASSPETHELYQWRHETREAPSLVKHPHVRQEGEYHDRRTAKGVGYEIILDVGCGRGYLLSMLKPEGRALCGLDVSPAAARAAKTIVRDASFLAGEAQNVPFKSDSFDYLICTELLEHLQGDGAIREFYRVLKPGGTVLITVPNGKGPEGKFWSAHIRFFSFSSIMDFLKGAGFEIVSGQKFGLYIPFVTRFIRILSHLLDKNLPFSSELNIEVPEFLAATFLIECRKPPT